LFYPHNLDQEAVWTILGHRVNVICFPWDAESAPVFAPLMQCLAENTTYTLDIVLITRWLTLKFLTAIPCVY